MLPVMIPTGVTTCIPCVICVKWNEAWSSLLYSSIQHIATILLLTSSASLKTVDVSDVILSFCNVMCMAQVSPRVPCVCHKTKTKCLHKFGFLSLILQPSSSSQLPSSFICSYQPLAPAFLNNHTATACCCCWYYWILFNREMKVISSFVFCKNLIQ